MSGASINREASAGIPAEPIAPVRFDARDLDPDGDPRVDLDAFVNARWRANHPVPADRSCWDAFAILTERSLAIRADIAATAAGNVSPGTLERIVGDFWRSGTEAAADVADALTPELTRINGLYTPAAIAAYIRDRHARGIGVAFRFDVEPDFDAPTRAIAFLGQGGLGLPDRDDYFDATSRGIARRRAYLAYVQAMLELASGDGTLGDDVLAFETRLAEASAPRRVLARDIAQRYRPVTIEEAERATPDFSWTAFFGALDIEPPAKFSLSSPAFFKTMNDALREVSAQTWRAYLAFHTADDAAPFVGGELSARHHAFHGATLRGQSVATPRWKLALETIDSHVGDAMGELFVARCFPAEARQQLAALAEQLRAALRSRLERADWMSEATRRAALRKLAALAFKLGCPEHWRDWSGLETNPRSLHANVLAARAFNQNERIARIGRQVDRARWPMPPQTVNAGYDPLRNEVVFPAALLQPPFFDANADAALNYGGIGAVIAHELIHAFDDQGSRFGADGRFENWWTADDRAHFEALAARMSDRFDALPGCGGDKVDGRLTLGENIADFGGLAVAFDALNQANAGASDPLLDGYTQAQRFFFNWAVLWRQNLTLGEAYSRMRGDTHAPAAVRANAAPANLLAYAETFGCRAGDPMRLPAHERIRIW